MNTKHKKHRLGFTLVEFMIVVAIVGLLAAIAIPNFVRAKQYSEIRQAHPSYTAEQIKSAWERKYANGNSPTPPAATSSPTVNGTIINKMVINDPKGAQLYTVVVIETNYYTVGQSDYINAIVGNQPTFNKN